MPTNGSCDWVQTPDGKSLIVGTRGDGVHVFDLQTGKETKALPCDESPQNTEIRVLALTDGKTLAVGTKVGNVFIFDLEKGKVLQKIPFVGERSSIDLLAFSPDGKRLAAASLWSHVVQILDPAAGTKLDILRVSHAVDDLCTDLSVLAYSPDGKTLAMGGLNAVELWDIAQFGFRDDFAGRARGGEVDRLVFSPDGKTLVSAGTGATVMFWDVPAGVPRACSAT